MIKIDCETFNAAKKIARAGTYCLVIGGTLGILSFILTFGLFLPTLDFPQRSTVHGFVVIVSSLVMAFGLFLFVIGLFNVIEQGEASRSQNSPGC